MGEDRRGQIGAGLAAPTTDASLRQIGILTNPYLLRGVAFEICFAAAIIYLPPLQSLFHTAGLEPAPARPAGHLPLHRLGRRRGPAGRSASVAEHRARLASHLEVLARGDEDDGDGGARGREHGV